MEKSLHKLSANLKKYRLLRAIKEMVLKIIAIFVRPHCHARKLILYYDRPIL